MKSDDIILFLKSHPLISVRALEKECQVPASTIKNAVSLQRDIPEKHIDKIIPVLKKYGLK